MSETEPETKSEGLVIPEDVFTVKKGARYAAPSLFFPERGPARPPAEKQCFSLVEMPTITNFGDVVTTGNSVLQGNLSVLNQSTFLTGNLLPNVANSSNLGQSAQAFGSSWINSMNALSLNVSTANITTLNVASINIAGANVAVINVASANVSTANVVSLNVSATANIAGANVAVANIASLNVFTGANISTLTVSTFANILSANIVTTNAAFLNVTTANVASLNVSTGANVTWLTVTTGSNPIQSNIVTANIRSSNVSTENVVSLNVSSTAFLSGANVTTANIASLNVTSGANVTVLTVSTLANIVSANVVTANVGTGNVATENVVSLNVSGTAFLSNANVLTGNITSANIVSLNVTGDANIAQNLTLKNNLYTSNIIMSSNLSTNTGQGNVYISANLVVNGNIYSIGGSVGSGSGTSQGVTYVLGSNYVLPAAFATGTAGPGIAGYHINMTSFSAQAVSSVSSFSATSGMLKFTSAGLYQVQCVLVGDQPVAKVGIGSTSSSSFPPSVSATSGYVYVYNYPLNSSPTTLVTIPLTITDTSMWYYLDVYFSTVVGAPTVLYQTAPPSGSAAGSNYGTYIQVGPFGNYLTSATGVAAGLLANCSGSSNLSGSYSSNSYRITLTTANGWTVNGTSTAITAPTANGYFTVNQAGIYEVSMCLNTVGATPVQFQLGSLASDTLVPNNTTPSYVYSYAPMYTQDPTTTISMPVNITNISNVYFVECSFQGSSTANIALSSTSTFLSIKPVGSYVTPATNPWSVSGSLVYYSNGAVGIGTSGSPTETLTVYGNTSFTGNVTVTSDASSNLYVNAKRVPAGSLSVANYVTGSVPLTTTTSLINGYLSNAAAVVTNAPTYNPALSFPGTLSSYVNLTAQHSAHVNTGTSNLFVEAWIYMNSTTGVQYITGVSNTVPASGEDWALYVNSGTLYMYAYGVNNIYYGSGGLALSAGTWTHVAGSYNSVTKSLIAYKNGIASTAGPLTGTARYFSGNPFEIGAYYQGSASTAFNGYVYDMRVLSGSIVPTASFTGTVPATPAVFGLTAPSYVTNMGLGGSANVALSLQSQYFPGASTSPYGPCLTLPGTVGSYYSAGVNSAFNTNWGTSGITLEAWVNYASFANANVASSNIMSTLGHFQTTGGNVDWSMGASIDGSLRAYYNGNGSGCCVATGSGAILTGQWTHIVFQSNGSRIFLFVNGTQRTDLVTSYTNTGTGSAASIQTPVILDTTVTPLAIGQTNAQGPNFSVAKARLVFGTSATPTLGNVYSTGNFTPSPNFASAPNGASVAWSLDSQFALPTYPSIQDVTELPQQAASYGSLPTPVGGVTSNVLSPYSTTYPQLDSIRFDGTGYIDYGNAASSVVNSNLWASPWTIEGWVYQTNPFVIMSRATTTITDWAFGAAGSYPAFYFNYGGTNSPSTINTGTTVIPTNTWTHLAVTYDGTRSNIYMSGALSNSMVVPTGSQTFYPQLNTYIGLWAGSPSFTGNLADVRVSNVARYTGSTYVVPNVADGSGPFKPDANTLLLLKSLNQQVGTTLEVQGRGLNSTSIGAGRNIYSFPPAPMSSYLLDTTSNASVTYGQGKYVASASSEYDPNAPVRLAFDKSTGSYWCSSATYTVNVPYSGSVSTVDTLGTTYKGEWIQLQLPVSLVLSGYSLYPQALGPVNTPGTWYILGSRDGINWTLVDSRSGVPAWSGSYNTYQVQATQGYNYYRLVCNVVSNNVAVAIAEWTLNGTEESLCVTSDSKVGVGIANPQRALEVAGDLVVGGTVSAGNPLMYRNRIINGDMRIAQRGTSNVVPNGSTQVSTYLIDRFQVFSNVATGVLTQYQTALAASDSPYQVGLRNYANLTVNSGFTASNLVSFVQVIEGYHVADLMWGTSFGQPVTLSFWFRTNAPSGSVFNVALGMFGAQAQYLTTVTAPQGTWQYQTVSVPPPPNWTSFNSGTAGGVSVHIAPYGLVQTGTGWNATGNAFTTQGSYNWPGLAGNFIHCTGVQLEKGTIATPWEQRPYATELALCQRYYQQFNCTASGGNYQSFGAGTQQTSTLAYTILPLVVPMRTNSTLTSNSAPSTFALTQATASTVSSMALTQSSTNQNYMQWTITGGSAGQGVLAVANGTTSAFLGFSAEL